MTFHTASTPLRERCLLKTSAFPQHFAKLDTKCFTKAWTADDFTTAPNRFQLSLWEKQSCLAYAYGSLIADELEIWRIGSDPAHRRQGHALFLFKGLQDLCKKRCVAQVILEVSSLNEAALAFYKCVGFHQVGLRSSYYHSGDHAILMRLDL